MLCAGLLGVFSGLTVMAQENLGTITGTLYDPNEKVLTGFTGAVLTARNSETRRDYKAGVSTTGEYQLSGLPPDLAIPQPGAMY